MKITLLKNRLGEIIEVTDKRGAYLIRTGQGVEFVKPKKSKKK